MRRGSGGEDTQGSVCRDPGPGRASPAGDITDREKDTARETLRKVSNTKDRRKPRKHLSVGSVIIPRFIMKQGKEHLRIAVNLRNQKMIAKFEVLIND